MEKSLIRNFSIIAHIDHGKSTLADRLLLRTDTITEREFHEQLLDDMDLERERGITIKASCVRMNYTAKDGKTYLLNLIDTPGHVDFTYEVSKSLSACEGVLLVVDASQGVEAQTVANLYMALEHHLVIIPIVNKIDLPNAEPEKVEHQIRDILNLKEEKVIYASAKEGIGTNDILEEIVERIPPPVGKSEGPLKICVIDSVFNTFKGVVIFVRVVNGSLKNLMSIEMMSTKKVFQVLEVGVFKPGMEKIDSLGVGEVGYFTCNIRDPKEIIIGDTVTDASNPCEEALPGLRKFRPMVYSGIYPVNSKDFAHLKDAIDKLKLNDASFVVEPESSASLGFGFRAGFLGLLHMEIIEERLEREFDLNLVLTTPSVVYKVKKTNGEYIEIDNPTKLPSLPQIDHVEEPFIRASILAPTDSLGTIMELAKARRGIYISTEYLSEDKVRLSYEMPLCEVLVDFYDKIKSITRGYGSFDYEFKEYLPSKLVKLDILLNGEMCDALSSIVHKEKAYDKGKALVGKLQELIPRQMFEVAIQAAIGGQIIARETVRAIKKNVTAKCYGGDITRKRKLWEKQKEGKKRMKQFGRVEIPQEAFMAAIKI